MAYDCSLALMCGNDIPIAECQLVLHQPRIQEIALIGDSDFFTAIQTLCVNKYMIAQGETLLANTNNFQIFMTIIQEKTALDKKYAVEQLLPIIFPGYKVIFSPRSLIFSKGEQTIVIDESNFEPLQKIIERVFCIGGSGPMDLNTFNPRDAKGREIADKLMRARQRVAQQHSEEGGSVFARYMSVIAIGSGSTSLLECTQLTMYQLLDLLERYGLYTQWDLDIKARLAGAKSDSKPENWMKNIH